MNFVQRLNIPLHRYQHTTRLSRRVVSVSVISSIIGLFLALLLGIWWFQRDTTSKTAPVGTTTAVHFAINRANQDDIERLLSSFPLVSNRSITLRDIKPYLYGEFSLFLTSEGIHSVTIRSKKSSIPFDILDSLGILVEEVGKNLFLLSDRPVARSNWNPPHNLLRSFHFPFKTRIADLYELESNRYSAVYSSNKQVTIRADKLPFSELPLKYIPKSTIAAIATPIFSINMNELLPNTFDLSQLKEILNTQGYLILAQDEKNTRFLFSGETINFDKDQQHKLIKASASFKQPLQQNFDLPDMTTATEIIVDTSLSTIEETTISGSLVSRIATSAGEYIYAVEKDKNFAVTNSEELLNFWLKEPILDDSTLKLSGNIAFLNTDLFINDQSSEQKTSSNELLLLLSDRFETISINNGLLFSTITLNY